MVAQYSKKRSVRERIMSSKVTLILLLVIAAMLGNAVFNMYGRYQEAKTRADRARAEIAALESRKKELSDDLARLGTPRGTEEELRKRFNVAADGEEVIVVVNKRATTSDNDTARKESIWQKVLNLFEW